MPASEDDTNWVVVAKCGAPFGIRGANHLYSYTSPDDQLFNYASCHIHTHKGLLPVSFTNCRRQGGHFAVNVDQCQDRDMAQSYTNCFISIPKSELPELPDSEYYWSDLIGLTVVTTTGTHLGVVTQIVETSSNDVFIVKNDDTEHWVPYTTDAVQCIDINKKIITVDWDPDF